MSSTETASPPELAEQQREAAEQERKAREREALERQQRETEQRRARAILNEADFRRKSFNPDGIPIELGDGSVWTFPRPHLELTPTLREDGTYHFPERFVPFGSTEFDAKIDEYIQANGIEELNAILSLAVMMLARNYELTPEQLRILLPFRHDDEINREMWQAIGDVALGRAPKATPGGSEPVA